MVINYKKLETKAIFVYHAAFFLCVPQLPVLLLNVFFITAKVLNIKDWNTSQLVFIYRHRSSEGLKDNIFLGSLPASK